MALGNFVFLFFTGRLLAKICHKIEKYKRYSLAIASYKLQEPVWQLSLQLSCDNVITGSPAMVKLLIFGQITNVIEYKINWKNNKIIFICGVILEQLRCYKMIFLRSPVIIELFGFRANYKCICKSNNGTENSLSMWWKYQDHQGIKHFYHLRT